MDRYHVTKQGDQWKLTKEGAQRASKIAPTKEKIIQETRDFMRNREGTVKIHKVDGKIQEERTYPRSSDPSKTAG